jgi:hypothetical protein
VKGEGSYSIADFRLWSLTPAAFSTSLAGVKDADGITAAFDQLRGGEGVSVRPGLGRHRDRRRAGELRSHRP